MLMSRWERDGAGIPNAIPAYIYPAGSSGDNDPGD